MHRISSWPVQGEERSVGGQGNSVSVVSGLAIQTSRATFVWPSFRVFPVLPRRLTGLSLHLRPWKLHAKLVISNDNLCEDPNVLSGICEKAGGRAVGSYTTGTKVSTYGQYTMNIFSVEKRRGRRSAFHGKRGGVVSPP